jgi:PAS domain S-box-containing protein
MSEGIQGTPVELAQAYLAAIVEATDDAIVGLSLDGLITSWNRGAERLFGYSPDEIVGQPITRLVPPERAIDELTYLARIADGERLHHFETQRVTADGRRIDVSLTVSPIFDDAGAIVGASKILRDVSDRRTADLTLQRSEAEFRALVENSPDIIARFDADLRHLYVSPSIVTVADRPQHEFLGRTNRELGMPEALCERWEAAIKAAFRDATVQTLEFSFPTTMGVRYFNARLVPEHDGHGRVRSVVGVTRDISEHFRAELQVRAMNETLEQRVAQRTAELRQLSRQLVLAEQSERRRLSMLLHDDLQQLLVAACMRMDLLTERLRGSYHEDAVRRVMELLQQSIESSRSLSHELSPPILYDSGLCATLPWLARIMRERHGLDVTVDVDPDAEPGDEETRISLFLSARELLFNVVKHARVNAAYMSLEHTSDGFLRMVVADDGEGFDPSAMNQACEDSFGLFSLRERIQFLGGHLDIDSAPSRGTRVTVELPAPEPVEPGTTTGTVRKWDAGEPVGLRSRSGQSAIRVLLADDHRILREGVVGILAEHADITVVAEAADGVEALEFAQRHRPDVIVMDVTMPRMNGVEATRRVTEQLPGIVVLGLTMHDSPDMAQAMKDAGAREVLVKDGPSDALIRAIRAAVPAGRRAAD